MFFNVRVILYDDALCVLPTKNVDFTKHYIFIWRSLNKHYTCVLSNARNNENIPKKSSNKVD